MKDYTAHVDLQTGKIYGCKKYSWKWWHEKGHIDFNNNSKTSFLLVKQQYIFYFWMLFVMASFMNRFFLSVSILLWVFYIGIMFYEEWWCNRYADKHYKPKHL